MRNSRDFLLAAAFLCATALLASCGGGGAYSAPPAPTITSVTVACSPTTIAIGATSQCTATVMGTGSFSPAVSWKSSSTAVATVDSTGKVTGVAAGTATITATSTQDPTKSGTASVTVNQRVITISLVPPTPSIPNNEIYSDFGTLVPLTINCTGCETGDILNIQTQNGGINTDPYLSGHPWIEVLNSTGYTYEPGPIKIWATGTDGVTSNTLRFVFTGSQNVAVQDPSSGEMYYYNSGNGTQASGAILKFKPDGTSDGSCTNGTGSGAAAIAFDNQTGYVLLSELGGFTPQWDSGCNLKGSTGMTSTSPQALAVDSHDGGLACIVKPEIDAAYCYNVQEAVTNGLILFAIPGIPAGSQPAAIKVFDASHIVIYGRGDQTLRWYTISGTDFASMSATAAGTLVLSEFTPTDANYWGAHPFTGGWYLTAVGGTLGVMGQVVNADGTVSQKLALVNNTNQTLTHDVSLPGGTIRIAPDPTNNAILAEYPDLSGVSPVTRFTRVYVDTGNSAALTSTSSLVPGAGFFVTNDGAHIAVFVAAQADLQPNQ